jgi:hypothetical protein
MIGVVLRTIADLPMMIGVGLHPMADLPMMIGVGLPTTILVALLSIVLLVPATILPAIGGADILMGRPPTIVIATALPIVSVPPPNSTAAPTTIVLLLHTVADSECGPISLSPHSSLSLSVWIPSAVPSLFPRTHPPVTAAPTSLGNFAILNLHHCHIYY